MKMQIATIDKNSRLTNVRFSTDLVPENYTAEGLLESFKDINITKALLDFQEHYLHEKLFQRD